MNHPARISRYDVIVIGAGAAGMMCAAEAGKRGRRVLILDHATKLAEKIRISGGGRCNFTNLDVGIGNYLSRNPQFCRSALARYTPAHFIGLVDRHGIPWHEREHGQLFCDDSAQDIIDMLRAECEDGAVNWAMPCTLQSLAAGDSPETRFILDTSHGRLACASLVVATGGLSIPKIGATPLGYKIAEQFGLPIIAPKPALVPLTFDAAAWSPYAGLAGLSLPVHIETGARKNKAAFREDLLFTHRGLSGPAVLQISSYWQEGTPLAIDLAPTVDLPAALAQAKARSDWSVPMTRATPR